MAEGSPLVDFKSHDPAFSPSATILKKREDPGNEVGASRGKALRPHP